MSEEVLPNAFQAPLSGPGGILDAVARALAGFLGGFSLLNLLGRVSRGGFDVNCWWIDLRAMDGGVAAAILCVAGLCLTGYWVNPRPAAWRQRLTCWTVGFLMLAAICNAVQYYCLVWSGVVRSGSPVPLSVFIVAALGVILRSACRSSPVAGRAGGGRAAALALAACVAAFPLAQMFFFGTTDYRRRADAIVVFGARAYRDGRPSDALADRVRTACRLYHEGLSDKLVFSGGPGDGGVHETQAMRRLALELGVPDQAILLDEGGVNTRATVVNTRRLFGKQGVERVLAVSHFYHLPRIKMSYQQVGVDVYTVPARESYVLRQMPLLIAREVVAFWAYYLRPLVA